MTELSPETRALLEKGGAIAPLTPQHRARLKRSLFARAVGGAVLATTSTAGASTPAAPKAVAIFASKVVVGIATATLIAGAGARWYRGGVSSPAQPAASVSVAPSSMEKPALEELPAATPIAPDSPSEPKIVSPRKKMGTVSTRTTSTVALEERGSPPIPTTQEIVSTNAAPPGRSGSSSLLLQEEARLLREADHAIKIGDTVRGLLLLEEHATRFPTGVLEPERAAEKVFALCRAGRIEDAHSEADHFFAVPRPPSLQARVRASCGGQTR